MNKCIICNKEFDSEFASDCCMDCSCVESDNITNKYSGTKTEENLIAAYLAESQARSKYNFFSGVAKKEGYGYISQIFTETENNELAHAKVWYKELNGISTTLNNLIHAAQKEHNEWTNMYVEFAEVAKKEGFSDLAYKFQGVADIEKSHEERFLNLYNELKDNKIFSKDETVVWECRNCGHLHTGKNALMKCPVCDHPQSYFEVRK